MKKEAQVGTVTPLIKPFIKTERGTMEKKKIVGAPNLKKERHKVPKKIPPRRV